MSENVPCDLDTERLILGLALAGRMDELRAVAEAEDFHLEKHRRIWAAITAIYDAGEKVDCIVTRAELDRRGQIKSVDGFSYLTSLDEGCPQYPNLEKWVAMLREKAVLRRLLILSDNIGKRCMAGQDTAQEITDNLSAAIAGLSNGTNGKRAISSREMIDQYGIETLLKARRTEGLRLPWALLNSALSGMCPGQMIVMAADTGRGKTSFALQVAMHATRQARSPVIWTLEMSPQQMFRRMVVQGAHVDADRERHGVLNTDEITRRKDAAMWMHGHPVWFDSHSRTVQSFAASLRQAKAKSDVGLAVVDYLQLIGGASRDSRAREVGENSRALKLLAIDLEIPILVLSQFRRMGDKEANIHSLKESGDIENDADVVLLLTSANLGGNVAVEVNIRIGKQREGPAGFDVPLIFDPPSQSFTSPEGEA